MPAPPFNLGSQPLPVDDFKLLLKGQFRELETKLVAQYDCTFRAWKDENQQLKDVIVDWHPIVSHSANGVSPEEGAEVARSSKIFSLGTTPKHVAIEDHKDHQTYAAPRRQPSHGNGHLRPPQDSWIDVGELTSRDEVPKTVPKKAEIDLEGPLSTQQDVEWKVPEPVAKPWTMADSLNSISSKASKVSALSAKLAGSDIDPAASLSNSSWQVDRSLIKGKTNGEKDEDLSDSISLESPKSPRGNMRPVGLKVAEVWLSEGEEARKVLCQKTGQVISYTSDFMTNHSSTGRVGDKLVEPTTCMQPFMIHPDGQFRIVWACIGAALITWDILVIPMLVFEMEDTIVTDTLGMTSAIFWTLDLILQFFIGYHDQGVIEMRPRHIAIRYSRTWLAPDLLITALDWCYLSVSYAGGTRVVRLGKSFRVMRLLRVVRLVRFLKMARMINKLFENTSEYLNVIMKLVRIVLFIVIVNHFIGCSWYGIAGFAPSDEFTWIKDQDLRDATIVLKYSCALHWSLTQFTPATNNIVPVNARERIFACLVVIFALITFSTFVSSITTAMQQLWNLSAERMKEEEKIRNYLSQKRVSMQLGTKIWQSFRQNLITRRESMLERDISFFADMPESLRQQLHKEVRMPHLTMHPFYHQYEALDITAMINICHVAVAEESYNTSMDVFMEGEATNWVRYVITGQLQYGCRWLKGPHIVRLNRWLSECAMWSNWTHRGRLHTVTHCDLIKLDVSKILDIACQRDYSFESLQIYARKFAQLYETEVPTDLMLEFDQLQEIAQLSFETSIQGFLGTKSAKSGSKLFDDTHPVASSEVRPSPSLRRSTREGRESMNSSKRGSIQAVVDKIKQPGFIKTMTKSRVLG